MKKILNKARKIFALSDDLKHDLFYQSLPEENKRDYYAMQNAIKTFLDNL